MIFKKTFFYQVLPVVIAGLSIAVFVYAWTEPTTAPPAGNVAAPLNVGNVGQSKEGGLILNTGGATNGLIVANGNVGIGTTAPGAKLQIAGPGGVDGTNGLVISGLGSAATKAIDVSNTGLSGSGDYLFYQGASNYWRADGNVRVDNGIQIEIAASGNNQIILYDAQGNDLFSFQAPNFSGGVSDLTISGTRNNSGFIFAPFGAGDFTVNTDAGSDFKVGTNQLYIQGGTGNVGVGTGTPVVKLDVNGQIRIAGGSPGAGKVLTSDASGLASWQTSAGGGLPSGSSGQTLRHDGTNWIANSAIYNDGTNIGIGTTPNSGTKLHVLQGALSSVAFRVDDEAGDTSPFIIDSTGNVGVGTVTPGVKLEVVGGDEPLQVKNNNYYFFAGANRGGGDYVDIGAYQASVGWKNLILNRGGGNVGIGTTGPGAKLQIDGMGSANATALRIEGVDLYKRDILFTEFGTTAYGGIIRYDGSADILQLVTLENSVEKQGIAIARTTGNVGIGTTGPGAKLDVNMQNPSGWSGPLEALRITSPDTRYWMDLRTYVVAGGNVGYEFRSRKENGVTYTGLVQDTYGNVGIGTTNPSQRLDVAGYVKGQTGLCIGNDCRTLWSAGTMMASFAPGFYPSDIESQQERGLRYAIIHKGSGTTIYASWEGCGDGSGDGSASGQLRIRFTNAATGFSTGFLDAIPQFGHGGEWCRSADYSTILNSAQFPQNSRVFIDVTSRADGFAGTAHSNGVGKVFIYEL